MVYGSVFFSGWAHSFSHVAIGECIYVLVLLILGQLCFGSSKSWQTNNTSGAPVFRKPWPLTAMPLWLSLGLGWCVWLTASKVTGVFSSDMILALLLLLIGVCFYIAAPEVTRFDLSARTFRYIRFWPGRSSHFAGRMYDISGIYVKPIATGRGGTLYSVRVTWRETKRPNIILGIFRDEGDANREGVRISDLLRFTGQDGVSPEDAKWQRGAAPLP